MKCVTNSYFSIIWNGQKLEPFQPKRGLRQGDSCVHISFVLCMEKRLLCPYIFCFMHGEAVFVKWEEVWKGWTASDLSGYKWAFNLLFADDVMFFRKATIDQARAMVLTLGLLHYLISGYKSYVFHVDYMVTKGGLWWNSLLCSPISWAHRDGKQGAHLIDWDLQVTLSKSSGRLGYHTSSWV